MELLASWQTFIEITKLNQRIIDLVKKLKGQGDVSSSMELTLILKKLDDILRANV